MGMGMGMGTSSCCSGGRAQGGCDGMGCTMGTDGDWGTRMMRAQPERAGKPPRPARGGWHGTVRMATDSATVLYGVHHSHTQNHQGRAWVGINWRANQPGGGIRTRTK